MLHEVKGLDTMQATAIDLNGKTVYQYTQNRIPKKHDAARQKQTTDIASTQMKTGKYTNYT